MRKVIKPEEHLEQRLSDQLDLSKETFHMTEPADCSMKHVSSISWFLCTDRKLVH